MALLPLSDGNYAVVDDDDFSRLSVFSWHCSNGRVYRLTSGKGGSKIKNINLTREVLLVTGKSLVVHLNGNPLDNRKHNLYCKSVSTHRVCTKCGRTLPISEFWHKRRKCRSCYKTYYHERYELLRVNDPVKFAEMLTLKGEASKKRYAANPSARYEATRRWRRQHPEQLREHSKRYYKRHPDAARLKDHRRRALEKGSPSLTSEEWQELKKQYGNRCLCCGRLEDEVGLTMDHVVPLSRGGTLTVENIQPLCKSCNCSKGVKEIDYRKAA